MHSKEEIMKARRNLIIIIIALALDMWLLPSCTTTRYVPVEIVRADTVKMTQWLRDSIWLHDSTVVHDQGDTVRIERWHTKYRDRQVHDTLYQSRTDSVPVPYPVTEFVERKLSWWQSWLMASGGVAWTLIVLVIVIFVIRKKLPL
ncbi:MAG: hypothetical protein IIZ97_04945 [Prevotella sp.]|nr:hypothetical protein [Prevotella sp.]